MWKPTINFITLHYTYITLVGVIALILLYPYGNVSAVDSYFFGVSASTESGLNPLDLKDLKTYQQIVLYFTPMITNLGFVNIVVVVVRLRWFRQRFKAVAQKSRNITPKLATRADTRDIEQGPTGDTVQTQPGLLDDKSNEGLSNDLKTNAPHIKFAPMPEKDNGDSTLRIPGPRERENGAPITTVSDDGDAIKRVRTAESSGGMRRRRSDTLSMSKATSVERAVSSIFVLGGSARRASQDIPREAEPVDLASLTRDELGGIEYRALRVLLKVTAGYLIGLHTFGVVCLLPWIHSAKNPKYRDYLASIGQDKTWWAFYSSQTMVDNLGLTLTPDSMITFQDATWPMLVFSFLAYAGNTFYPCFLRLLIWTIYNLSPKSSALREELRFLLDHPRRCYTLLFPSIATWALAAILFVLNFVDILIIITLDLHNPELTKLSPGPRILAAIFQAASSRHTGTASFNLANVNPAVQFSLLVMMYISIYPIAISIRLSGSYEETPVGIYEDDARSLDERRGTKGNYLMGLMRNQLSFDLWYVFLGVFCVCAAEAEKIMDKNDPSFHVFAIFFEIVSAYGNVGLSLGHWSNSTALCGHFTPFSKLVVCAMMIRGRHRGMPYALDRAVTLPSDRLADENDDDRYKEVPEENAIVKMGKRMKKSYTQ